MRRRKNAQTGMSMMELLVSINIIVLGVMIMAVVMCLMMKNSQKNLDTSSMYLAADSIMKEYIAKNKYDLSNDTVSNGSVTYANQTYRYNLSCSDTGNRLYYIKVTVFDDAGKAKVYISTLQRKVAGGSGTE